MSRRITWHVLGVSTRARKSSLLSGAESDIVISHMSLVWCNKELDSSHHLPTLRREWQKCEGWGLYSAGSVTGDTLSLATPIGTLTRVPSLVRPHWLKDWECGQYFKNDFQCLLSYADCQVIEDWFCEPVLYKQSTFFLSLDVI